jgi:diguanylate cyclase (GGDEF)-like protein
MFKLLSGKHYQSLLILILLTLLSVFAVTGYIAINNIVSEQSRIQQQAISPVYSLVNQELLKPLNIAETFAETITFEQLLDNNIDEAFLLERLARMEQRLGLIFFVALEKQRRQLMSDGRTFDLIEGKVYWYFEALNTDKRILADLGQVGNVHLFFDVKIYSDSGEFLGFVGVGKPIKSFVETLSDYQKQYGYEFLFVDENNQVLLSSVPDFIVTDEFVPELSSIEWFDDTSLDINDLNNVIVNHNDNEVLISEVNIPQLNWRLLLLTPLEARQAKLTQTFAVNALLASSVIIIVITGVFFAFITYSRKLEKRMEVDTLTGLSNRNYLQKRYQRLRKRAATVCVVMVDLDHFKQINDQHGHNTGDEVLKAASEVLKKTLRRGDTVCRWGGEEFVLLIPAIHPDDCLRLIENARAQIERCTVKTEAGEIKFTASFGITEGEAKTQLSKHLANADLALYESKRSGRNKVSFYKR